MKEIKFLKRALKIPYIEEERKSESKKSYKIIDGRNHYHLEVYKKREDYIYSHIFETGKYKNIFKRIPSFFILLIDGYYSNHFWNNTLVPEPEENLGVRITKKRIKRVDSSNWGNTEVLDRLERKIIEFIPLTQK